jgi:hypothetical protein
LPDSFRHLSLYRTLWGEGRGLNALHRVNVTRTRSCLQLAPNRPHILVRLAGKERHRRHVQNRSLETLLFQLTAAFWPTVFHNPLSQKLDDNDSHLSCGNNGNPGCCLSPRHAPEEVAGCKEPVPVSGQGAYRYPLNRTCHDPEGTDKLDDVNALIRTNSWRTLGETVAKRDVVCSNCHRIRAHARFSVQQVPGTLSLSP